MRASIVSLSILSALGAASAGRALASDNRYLASMASAVDAAPRIEAWRLSCRDTTNPRVVIEGVAIDIGQAADLDSTARAELAAILRAASGDTSACEDYRCNYCPAYRLIIEDRDPPISVVITHGCIGWSFTRGYDRLSNEHSCGYLPDRFVEPLRTLLKKIYGAQYEN